MDQGTAREAFEKHFPILSNLGWTIFWDRDWRMDSSDRAWENEVAKEFGGGDCRDSLLELDTLDKQLQDYVDGMSTVFNILFEDLEEARAFLAGLRRIMTQAQEKEDALQARWREEHLSYPAIEFEATAHTITVRGKEIAFEAEVCDVCQYRDIVVVRLDPSMAGERNVLGLNVDGEIIWSVEACPAISTETRLRGYRSIVWRLTGLHASSWTGHDVSINPKSGAATVVPRAN